MPTIERIDFERSEAVFILEKAGIKLPAQRVAPIGLYRLITEIPNTGLIKTSGFGSYDSNGDPIVGMACNEGFESVWRPMFRPDLPFLKFEQLKEAAACTARRVLSELQIALPEGLLYIKRIVEVIAAVNCVPGYTKPHLVANGASEILQTAGKALGWKNSSPPVRMTTGPSSLPDGLAFELQVTFSKF